ncbi:MAG: hypothetical protein GX879_07480 [Bacteroidales bacterium]|nr:hypothetical protein [Bacteroidales bacterium]
MKYFLTFLFLSLILLSSCKPDKVNIFHGNISELISNKTLSNVQVDIEVNKLSSGIISSYKLAGTSFTDDEGYFKIELEAAQALSYRITLSKTGYHSTSFEIIPNDIAAEYVVNKGIPREAWLKFKIKNIPPALNEDVFRYRILDINPECTDCCSNRLHSFNGIVDTTTICPLVAYDTIKIEYFLYSNGNSNQFIEELIVSAGDTIVKEMRY